MLPEEVIVYRSPLEKAAAEWLAQHPAILIATGLVFTAFFLLVLAGVVAVFIKVFSAMREDAARSERRRRAFNRRDW